MKVLHINTEQVGGAAWCVQRISNALVKKGIDSRILFARGNTVSDDIIGTIAEPDINLWYSNPKVIPSSTI